MPPRRVTEAPNELSDGLDVASPHGMLDILDACDEQMWTGVWDIPGVFDASVVASIDSLGRRVGAAIAAWRAERSSTTVVFCGAGTSGRLAFVLATVFNRALDAPRDAPLFRYRIAGGDLALFASQERAEDLPEYGSEDLAEVVCEGKTRHVVYVGITCGMSAPYVAGQVDWLYSDAVQGWLESTTVAILGFNSVEASRTDAIRGWKNKTFRDVVDAVLARAKDDADGNLVINPCLGPEAVTGSSRMKGGSMTKVLLEVAFARAVAQEDGADVGAMLAGYRAAVRAAYAADVKDAMAPVLQAAGDALCSGARISYVGVDTFGIFGVIDASEQRPTFGAKFADIRGYMITEKDAFWTALADERNEDLCRRAVAPETIPEAAHNGVMHLESAIVPTLGANDLLIFLLSPATRADHLAAMDRVRALAEARNVRCASIAVGSGAPALTPAVPMAVQCAMPAGVADGVCSALPLSHAELSLKLLLNAVSTCAHVLKGTVYRNQMVSVQVSNQKLYLRAIGIIARVASVDAEAAEAALLTSVYELDSAPGTPLGDIRGLAAERLGKPWDEAIVGDHVAVAAATGSTILVPIALLVATGMSRAQACAALKVQPIVRKVLLENVSSS